MSISYHNGRRIVTYTPEERRALVAKTERRYHMAALGRKGRESQALARKVEAELAEARRTGYLPNGMRVTSW